MDNDKYAMESAEWHHEPFTSAASGDSDDEFSSDGASKHILMNSVFSQFLTYYDSDNCRCAHTCQGGGRCTNEMFVRWL